MTGPANLLEVVAPERRGRRHARRRIDHGLDGTDLEIYGKTVRKLIAEAAAAASGYGGRRRGGRQQRLTATPGG